MNKSRIIIIVILVAVIVAGAVIGFLLLLNPKKSETIQQGQRTSSSSESSNQHVGISLEEVAKHTGKDGNSCWVAVDGTVYEISGFVLWVEGEHKPSGGRAKCGKDLSEVIKQSPHGKSKLKLLKEIGPLQQ